LREIENELSFNCIIHFVKDIPTTSTGCGISNPCLNSGVCIPSVVGYECQCLGNYGGSNCESSSGIRNRIRYVYIRIFSYR
jgi:hypothetical protein